MAMLRTQRAGRQNTEAKGGHFNTQLYFPSFNEVKPEHRKLSLRIERSDMFPVRMGI